MVLPLISWTTQFVKPITTAFLSYFVPCVSKWVIVQHLSYTKVFDLHESEPVEDNGICFAWFAQGLILTLRQISQLRNGLDLCFPQRFKNSGFYCSFNKLPLDLKCIIWCYYISQLVCVLWLVNLVGHTLLYSLLNRKVCFSCHAKCLWTQRYNKYLTNLVFSLRTVRAWAINPSGKNLVHTTSNLVSKKYLAYSILLLLHGFHV